MQLSSKQIRAARALLGWSQGELVKATRLGVRTVKRAEAGESITPAAELSIRNAFESQGLVFVFRPEDITGRDFVAGVVTTKPD